jgi:hypothetical protein
LRFFQVRVYFFKSLLSKYAVAANFAVAIAKVTKTSTELIIPPTWLLSENTPTKIAAPDIALAAG